MKTIFTFLTLAFLIGCMKKNDFSSIDDDPLFENIISVIERGINNNGEPIGSELNDLIKNSYGTSLYFPAGVYNLTEPIVLPLDYTKNVNLILDNNAYVKSDQHLEALLKVGFSEISIVDRTHRRFSYIKGGIFDCYNADNGIVVNGLKQLVSLKEISLVRGQNTHIRIEVTDDFNGTGSCDTKIDNITIQGISSNDNVQGIYIGESCADVKISNSFIYSTKYGIVTKSPGHVVNNVHILSKNSTGGTDRGHLNYRDTEGIHIGADGFFVFNQIYFDTVDKGIVVESRNSPTLMLDQNMYYSYLDKFGTAVIFRENSSTKPLTVKMSNSIITASNSKFKIFDINPAIVGYDIEGNFKFINSAVHDSHNLSPYELTSMQKVRNIFSDAYVYTHLNQFESDWYVLGALVSSPFRSKLHIDFADDNTNILDLKFENMKLDILSTDFSVNNPFKFGYVIKDDFCVLVMRPDSKVLSYPVISDVLNNGVYLPPPSKGQYYRLKDYEISENEINLFPHTSPKRF